MGRVPEPDTIEMTTLGGFTLVDRIGAGGMGEVWRAERIGPGNVRRRAAVKRILPRFQRDPVLRERFIAEARITSRLEHPNIVQVLDFGDSPELFLILEYVDGVSMSDLIKSAARTGRRLPVAAAVYMIAEAAAGLDHAHRRMDDSGTALEIIHRDVTPSNVLLSVDGAVKVGDFGVARAADNLHRTEAGFALGKLPYMAPEQARGARVDRRVDVFALGICLWEALTLERLLPRGAPDQIIAALDRCEFQSPSSRAPGIPPALDDIVLGALQRDPARRTASAGELSRALRTLLAWLAPGFAGPDLARVIHEMSQPPCASAPAQYPAPSYPAMSPAPYAAVSMPPVERAVAPLAPAAPAISGAPAMSGAHRNVLVGGGLTIAALLAVVAFLALRHDASDVRTGTFEQYQIAQTRIALEGGMARTAALCANGTHGTATIDLDFLADGTPARVAVGVQGVPPPFDTPVQNCLQMAFSYTHIAPVARPIALHGLVARF